MVLATLKRWIPALDWMGSYPRSQWIHDGSAGLTTAVMLVPQGMAYALLAGLPPILGLYASTLPLILYSLFGTSRQLAVGPVAMVSLLVLSSASAVAAPGSAEFIGAAVLLALLTGAIQIVLGLFRAGFLVNFLSHPVISGFTSAAALVIGMSQLKHLSGVPLSATHSIFASVTEIAQKVGEVHLTTLGLGIGAMTLLIALRRYFPKFPRFLAVVVVSSLVVWLLDLNNHGVAIVGYVPKGLPSIQFPSFSLEWLAQLWPAAMTIALVGFMESVSVAKAFASKHRYEILPNQELIALGMANIGSAVLGALPVTGGFSRTAVNDQAGARSPMAAIVTALVIGLVLVAFTPLFHYLPKTTLAAIILVAVAQLVDIAEVKHLWHVKRADLALLVFTFVATLLLGIEEGIALGVGASLLWFVVRTTRPHTAVLGRLPGTTVYRNLLRFPDARPVDGVLILRIDAQFYFGNVSFLKETLRKYLAETTPAPHTVIIDASSINELDSSADAALHEIAEFLDRSHVRLYFASVKGPVRDVMQRSGFWEKLGLDRFVFEVHDAVVAATQTPTPRLSSL